MTHDSRLKIRNFVVIKKLVFLLFCVTFLLGMDYPKPKVKLGIDVFAKKYYKTFQGKKIGLITNQTGVNSRLEPTINILYKLYGKNLLRLFAPEHGIQGNVWKSNKLMNMEVDKETGFKIYNLYGKTKKPTKKMLKGIDVLIYDIQDIGNRTYTYISTMALAMQSAAENNVKFVILDRPIPVYGNLIDGNILEPEFSSFIGMYSIPYIYGMTVGELALYINKEFGINADLEVIKMEGYRHNMDYKDTGLLWVPTSPHIAESSTAYDYALTGCIGELETVFEGIGYVLPFKVIGAEWMDHEVLAKFLNSKKLDHVYFEPFKCKPFYGKFKNKLCKGVKIVITNRKKIKPFEIQLHIIETIHRLYPNSKFLAKKNDKIDMFEKATGTDKIRKDILNGRKAEDIIRDYQKDLKEFKRKRKKYLLY